MSLITDLFPISLYLCNVTDETGKVTKIQKIRRKKVKQNET